MSDYQDVVLANLPYAAWALVEGSGTDFAPYAGLAHLTGSGTLLYQQTGPDPTMVSLHLASGATLRAPTGVGWNRPQAVECWYKLDTYPPAQDIVIFYAGNWSGTNGIGLTVKTTGRFNIQESGVATVDTGVSFGTGWHLVSIGNLSPSGNDMVVSYDGSIVWQSTLTAWVTPNPQQVGFGCSGSTTCQAPCSVAMPAVYYHPWTANQAYSNWLSLTDKEAALSYSLGGGGLASQDILTEILNAVKRTY